MSQDGETRLHKNWGLLNLSSDRLHPDSTAVFSPKKYNWKPEGSGLYFSIQTPRISRPNENRTYAFHFDDPCVQCPTTLVGPFLNFRIPEWEDAIVMFEDQMRAFVLIGGRLCLLRFAPEGGGSGQNLLPVGSAVWCGGRGLAY